MISKFKIIAFLLSALTIIICAYLIMLYGLRLGYVDSKIWLTSSFMSLSQKFIVISPLKVLIIAIILASVFKPLAPVSNYKIKYEDCTVPDNLNNEDRLNDDYKNVIALRKQPFYKPISRKDVEVLRRKREKHKFILFLIECSLLSTYITILTFVIYKNFHFGSYRIGAQVDLLIFGCHSNEKVLRCNELINRTQLLEYILYTFSESDTVYRRKWYNTLYLSPSDDPPDYQYWTRDCTMKMLGLPTFRQMRVAQGGCSFNSIFKNVSLACIPTWSSTSADQDDYGYHWNTVWSGKEEEDNPWKYSRTFEFAIKNLAPPTGTVYPEEGYVAKLSTRPDVTRRVLLDLLSQGQWIDRLTRVIFLDLTLYNVNKNTFTQFKLVVEHLPFGLHVTRSHTFSVTIQGWGGFWNVCFAVIVLLLIMIYTLKLNHDGTKLFFSQFVNVYQTTLLIMAIISSIYFVIHTVSSEKYIRSFRRQSADSVFYFEEITKYKETSFRIAMLLLCCLIIRLMTLISSTCDVFMNVYNTMKSLSLLLFLMLILWLLTIKIHINVYYILSKFITVSGVFKGQLILKEPSLHGINGVTLGFPVMERFYVVLILLVITCYHKMYRNHVQKDPMKVFVFE